MRIGELAAAYAAGRDPHDVVEDVLARIDGRDGVWISRFDAAALHARADKLLANGTRGPLWGVPFAVKDNIDVAGLPTTAACPAFAHDPAADASSVARLLAAGAIAVGKVNLDQFATGLNGTRSPYGAPESVFGKDLISGGSSSGSAVAVAAGQVAFALGTDTAGSGRVPAAMNGIVGLKPTRGLVGATGMLPACRSLDCVTVFTRDLDDAEAVLAVLAGPDPDDPWSRTGTQLPAGLRLAVPEELELDAAFWDVFGIVAATAAERADDVHPTSVAPMCEAGDLLYSGPWVAERLAGLAPFLAEHADDVLPVVRGIVEQGARFDAVDCFRARHRLQELRAWTRRLWEHADVLLLPTTPTAFTRAEIREDPVGRNLVLGRYTQFGNLLDLAAVAVPGGVTPDGRPVGVTLLGPAFSEQRLLDAARRLIP
ncbi:MAG: allophanate hydrolase [Pseudonocardia sp.]